MDDALVAEAAQHLGLLGDLLDVARVQQPPRVQALDGPLPARGLLDAYGWRKSKDALISCLNTTLRSSRTSKRVNFTSKPNKITTKLTLIATSAHKNRHISLKHT